MVRKKSVRANGEGSVSRQKENLWAASATVDGKRKYFYGKTQKEAKDKREAFLRDVGQDVSVNAKKQTVAVFLQDWLENSQKQSLRPRSSDSVQNALLRPFLMMFYAVFSDMCCGCCCTAVSNCLVLP
jgi:hypothetical protein